MASHRMTHDRLPIHVGGKFLRDEGRQFFGYIAPHPIVRRKRFLGRIDVKAGAKTEVIGPARIVRDALATRAGVWRHEDEAERRASLPELALLGDRKSTRLNSSH